MLSARRLLFEPPTSATWSFIPVSLFAAYVVTLIANTTRILIALKLQGISAIDSLDSNQLHRLEGIFIYFLFLTLLFLVSERNSSDGLYSVLRRCFLPLLVYYSTMLGIPLLNGSYRAGRNFWEYATVVFLVPVLVLCGLCGCLSAYAQLTPQFRLPAKSKEPQSSQGKKRINSLLREEFTPLD